LPSKFKLTKKDKNDIDMLGEETSNRLGTQRDRLNLSNLIKVVSIPNNQTSQPLQNNPQSTA